MEPELAKSAHVWSKDALLAKAQRYAEEMLEHDRDDWRFVFWSSLTLESLARAALANVSPTLLAEHKDWNNLYFSLGHPPKTKKFVPNSIGISEVLTRLGAIFPEFDTRLVGFGVLHMQRRNEELHSGSTPFDDLGDSGWLPLFYETTSVLLGSMGEQLPFILGKSEAKVAKELIAAARDESAKSVAKSIEAHRTVWASRTSKEQSTSSAQAALWATRQAGHRVKCPACNSDALVGGVPIAPPNQKLKDGFVVETQEFLPSRFECIACGLKINGLAELHASGLGDSYKTTSTDDPLSFYASRDDYAYYEDDNNEP
jgi:hypothetical protein